MTKSILKALLITDSERKRLKYSILRSMETLYNKKGFFNVKKIMACELSLPDSVFNLNIIIDKLMIE